MRNVTDVIVMGLGAAGSAVAWALAKRGHRVTGFDRFSPPHPHGSTHGHTRITRATAWEGARYVPLGRRANTLWRELERESGVAEGTFLALNGGLFAAPAGSPFIEGSRESAIAHALPYELIDAAEIRARWPVLQVPDGLAGFIDPGAGILYPEPIVRAQHALAATLGADIHPDEPVESWSPDGSGVRVVTSRATYRAQRLVICTGAWMPPVLAPLGVALTVERNTMHWLAERTSAPKMDPSRFPVTLVSDDGIRGTAIFPAIHGSIKIATHHSAAFTTVDGIDRRISARDVAGVTSVAQRYLPRVAGAWERGMTCMYTNTPGGHFILDRHPEHPQVVLGSPCNGFGFKFSAATGEILAMLAVGEQPPVSPEPWSLEAARTPPS